MQSLDARPSAHLGAQDTEVLQWILFLHRSNLSFLRI